MVFFGRWRSKEQLYLAYFLLLFLRTRWGLGANIGYLSTGHAWVGSH